MNNRLKNKRQGSSVYIIDHNLWLIIGTVAFIAAIMFPLYAKARERARQASCLSSLKQICTATLQYCEDHDGKFPNPNDWNKPILKDYMRGFQDFCPEVHSDVPTYAMNVHLGGMKAKQVKDPHSRVLIYESVSGPDLAGGPELLTSPPRHKGGHNIGFVDGRAAWTKERDVSGLTWDTRGMIDVD